MAKATPNVAGTPSAAPDLLNFDAMGEAIRSDDALNENMERAAGDSKILFHQDEQLRHKTEQQMEKEVLKDSNVGVIDKAKAAVNVVSHSIAATYHGILGGSDDKRGHSVAGGLPDPKAVDRQTPTQTTATETTPQS